MEKHVIVDLIGKNALELYGQPKWTFGKNTCNTYELFVERLRLPGGETVLAEPLLKAVEQDELLTQLFSDWHLEHAMHAVMELSRQSHANITLSVNLLPLYADREDFVDKVLRFLHVTGLPNAKLQFELSEAQTLTPRGVENLNRLHDDHGIGLWLANFGTGHSNVDLLREVRFDGIELDRSFAAAIPQHDQTCRVIVGILHLAHTLDLSVCAKGIETQDQFEFFEELDCAKGQGYLIGKPMNLTDLLDYVKKYAVKRK